MLRNGLGWNKGGAHAKSSATLSRGQSSLLGRTPRWPSLLPLRWLHYRPAAIVRAALADVKLLQLRVVLTGALVLVIVGELLARLDAAQSMDEDLPPRDDGLAVRVARVVDETGVATARTFRTVDYRVPVEGEQEGVVPLHLIVVVTPVGLVVVDALAKVLDDPRALADVAEREDAAAVDVRAAHDVQGLTPIL